MVFSRKRGGFVCRGRNGQITVFVVLALVILFSFMFLFFVKIKFDKEKSILLAKQQIQDYINQNSLNIYVTNCIDSVASEAVIRASLQGGLFNFTNKTYGKDYLTVYVPEYNRTVNVSIAVVPNNNCSIVYNSPWEYPYPNVFIYPSYFLKNIYNGPNSCKYSGDAFDFNSGFFGRNQFPKLCNWNGTNRLGATRTYIGMQTCEQGTYSNKNLTSIQEEMERFIAEEMDKCINFNEVLSKTSSNITQSGRPKAIITFGENNFNVRVEYPFLVVIRGRMPIKTFYDFSVTKNIRFKELYDYSYLSLVADVQEAGFKFTEFTSVEDTQLLSRLAMLYRGYIISINKSIDSNHNDLIKIIDNSSKINGRPLIFQFVIKNRAPALDYITNYSGNLGVDIVVSYNSSFSIYPQGYDPDDDLLIYSYGSWKEDYDEYFNTSDDKCTGAGGQTLVFEYIKENCSIKNLTSKPKNFTRSILYLTTGKDAEYTPEEYDKGYHLLNVSVKESGRQGLEDWQLVKIFVFDSPKANITGNNTYPGVPQNIASIEDPYILNGSNSLVGLSQMEPISNTFSYFLWNDSMNEFGKRVDIVSERNKSLFLPLDLNNSEDILEIKRFVFNKIGKRNITLTVNTFMGLSDYDVFEVDVKVCIPYRNNSPAYPYNISNPYFSNHSCCSGDFYSPSISSSNSVCYLYTDYGINKSFFDFWTRQPSPPPQPKNIIYQGMSNIWNAQNDIFNRTFVRNCDGTRGNICNGTATEYRTVLFSCNDDNYNPNPAFSDERCSGPPMIYIIGSNTVIPTGCINYSASQSFESLAGILTRSNKAPDGKCTSQPQCANPSNPYSGFESPVKRYKCEGLCSQGKCSRIDISSCKCDSTCGGGGSVFCNGLSYSSYSQNLPNNLISCQGGNSLYEDSCLSCGLVDKVPNICRVSGSGRIGCTAPDIRCDGKQAKSIINDDGNEACRNNCAYLNCGNYKYNTIMDACFSSCVSDDQCALGYSCVSGSCIILEDLQSET
ncbi:MAG: hypothetical protein KatS3mg002_0472 [Candidatus Woesearchaeota archaeon]|nr:MAG: hypothetical protein KatS3mg002_0472 [Candidatus Woesearchaeota archaeon]